jgi:hypothetical protein
MKKAIRNNKKSDKYIKNQLILSMDAKNRKQGDFA